MRRIPVLRHLPILLALFVASSIKPVIAGPLHDAVRAGDKVAVLEALVNSQDVNETDFFLGAPLHVAVVEDRPEMVRNSLRTLGNMRAEGCQESSSPTSRAPCA